MILIGISGRKGSGKDAVCQRIMVHHPSAKRIAFGDAVKEDVCRMLMISLNTLESNKELYRPFLQWYGTDYMRKKFGEDIWLRRWSSKVAQSDAQIVIVPDVRFVNELELIRNSNGFVLKVERPSMMADDKHISETALDSFRDFDRHIMNIGSLQQVCVEVDVALEMCGLIPTT